MTVALVEFLEGVAVGVGVGVALDGTFAAAAAAADAIFEASLETLLSSFDAQHIDAGDQYSPSASK